MVNVMDTPTSMIIIHYYKHLRIHGENIANLMSMIYVKKVLDVLKGDCYHKVA